MTPSSSCRCSPAKKKSHSTARMRTRTHTFVAQKQVKERIPPLSYAQGVSLLCVRQQSVSQSVSQSVGPRSVKSRCRPPFLPLLSHSGPSPHSSQDFFLPPTPELIKYQPDHFIFFSLAARPHFPALTHTPGNFTLFSLLCARLGLRKLLPVPKSESLPPCCAKNPLLLIYPLPPSALVALPLAIFGSRHSRSHPSLKPAQPPLAIRPRRLTSARPRRRWAALHHSLGKTPNQQ